LDYQIFENQNYLSLSIGYERFFLYEEYFHLTNIEKDFLPVFKKFYNDEKLRTCPISGEVMEVDKRFAED